MCTSALCNICEKGPFLLRNLYGHLRTIYNSSEDEIKEVQLVVKRSIYAEELECEACGKAYFSAGLRRHRKYAYAMLAMDFLLENEIISCGGIVSVVFGRNT
ncbi:hypothetical protein ANCCAN_29184 [Ancylostoma caninum]|uniref:C2H2-type domain-containing protein n=1 Tax=Ancylostoma caninum TaxID=29170 RepID=A0A368EZ94_ANCCA|nr:hypothetical protein ANCCAN_29184 [Ancylostoma caninum]